LERSIREIQLLARATLIYDPCCSPFSQKTSFKASKWPRKLKTAKNSKLPKLPETCFGPVGEGGWPPISTWIKSHCNEIIIRRDVKFDENLLACEPNLTIVPSSACDPYSTFVPSYDLVSSSYDDSEDENPPSPTHPPPDESFEPEPAPAPPLPRWVRST
jgi:hypothetical protein